MIETTRESPVVPLPVFDGGHHLYVLGLPVVRIERLDETERLLLLDRARRRRFASVAAHVGRWASVLSGIALAFVLLGPESGAGSNAVTAIFAGLAVVMVVAGLGGGLVELLFEGTRVTRGLLGGALVVAGISATFDHALPDSTFVGSLYPSILMGWVTFGLGCFLVRFRQHRRLGARIATAVAELERGELGVAEGTVPPYEVPPKELAALGVRAGGEARLVVLPSARFVVGVGPRLLPQLADAPHTLVSAAPSEVFAALTSGPTVAAGDGVVVGTRAMTEGEADEVRALARRHVRNTSAGAALAAWGLALGLRLVRNVFRGTLDATLPAELWLVVLALVVTILLVRMPTAVRLWLDARGKTIVTGARRTSAFGAEERGEFLPRSGLVWTLDGKPGPGRLRSRGL